MQHALIVDDSRVAARILEKMLRRHDIAVTSVDSAEAAMAYLESALGCAEDGELIDPPQMIFMDHMMPGMDGFDAVKAIKANPALSAIPIVMHTSKSGNIYVGHARALGAADIIVKPASDQALAQVLARLEPMIVAAAPPAHAEVAQPLAVTGDVQTLAVGADDRAGRPARQRVQPETAQRAGDARPSASSGYTAQTATRVFSWPMQLAMLLFVASVLWLATAYVDADKQRRTADQQREKMLQLVAWSASQAGAYDYGEQPFAGERLLLLKGLLTRLSALGFKGLLRLEGHRGAFCLAEQAVLPASLYLLAEAELPLAQCASVGLPPALARQLSGQQSDAFKVFLANSPLLSTAAIRVELLSRGDMHPLYAYPEETGVHSAGDWNAIALRNNRVEFLLFSDGNKPY